jgi:acyl-ACP thioesterase
MQMETDRPSYDELQQEGKALMLGRLDLEIYDEIHVGDEFTVSSWTCQLGRATFPRGYEIVRDGKIVAEISSQWALVDMESRKVLKTEEVDFSRYYEGRYIELFPDKFRLPKDIEFREVGKHTVKYSDLDLNGHMNNTYYLDQLCNYMPELEYGGYRVKSLRIHYCKEAPLGDVLTIFRAIPEENKYLFKTVKANGETNIEAEIIITTIKNR